MVICKFKCKLAFTLFWIQNLCDESYMIFQVCDDVNDFDGLGVSNTIMLNKSPLNPLSIDK